MFFLHRSNYLSCPRVRPNASGQRREVRPMNRLHIKMRAALPLALIPVPLLALGVPVVGQAMKAGSSSSSQTVCHNIHGSVKVPAAPRGAAYVVITTLTRGCNLVESPPRLELDPEPLLSRAPANSSLTAGAIRSGSGDPMATSYYRLWDPVGILLNATYDQLSWSTGNGRITGATTTAHAIWAADGWINPTNTPGWNGGCVGCTSISSYAYDTFLFVPVPIYSNWDYAFITGDGNGGYSNCYQQWHWAVGFPGWHTQTWCAWGYNG